MKQPEMPDFSTDEYDRIDKIVDKGPFSYFEARRIVAAERADEVREKQPATNKLVAFEATGKMGRSTLSEPRYGYDAENTPQWTTPTAPSGADLRPLAEVRNLIEDHRAIGRQLGRAALSDEPDRSLTGPEIIEQARLSWGDPN